MMTTLHRDPLKDLGRFLLQRGWITSGQLRRGRDSIRLVGGRLDTILLEAAALEEGQLLEAISQLCNAPSADGDDLTGVPQETIDLVPARLAVAARAIPFRLVGGELWIAMQDLADLAVQDEIAFAAGHRLRIHVSTEARVQEALERYYGQASTLRMRRLIDQLNRRRPATRKKEEAPLLDWPDFEKVLAPEQPFGVGTPAGEEAAADRPAEAADGDLAGAAAADDDGGAAQQVSESLEIDLPSAAEDKDDGSETVPLGAENPFAAGESRAGESRGGEPHTGEVDGAEQAAAPEDDAHTADLSSAAEEAAGAAAESESQPESGKRREVPTSVPLTEEERRRLASIREGVAKRPADREAGPADEATDAAAAQADGLVAALHRRLAGEPDLQQVGEALADVLAPHFRRVILLKVQPQGIGGWLGTGEQVSPDSVERLFLGFDRPSVFLNLRQGVRLHYGPLAPMPSHQRLAECWGGGLPETAVVLPVRLRERMVAIIYADRSEAELAGLDLGEMEDVAAEAGSALERFLLRKKVAKA